MTEIFMHPYMVGSVPVLVGAVASLECFIEVAEPESCELQRRNPEDVKLFNLDNISARFESHTQLQIILMSLSLNTYEDRQRYLVCFIDENPQGRAKASSITRSYYDVLIFRRLQGLYYDGQWSETPISGWILTVWRFCLDSDQQYRSYRANG